MLLSGPELRAATYAKSEGVIVDMVANALRELVRLLNIARLPEGLRSQVEAIAEGGAETMQWPDWSESLEMLP